MPVSTVRAWRRPAATCELASELHADLAQVRVRPVAGEQSEEALVVTRGELDAGRLGRRAVRLRRTAGARAAGAAAEIGLDEAGGGEPLEAGARDVAVDGVVLCEVVGGDAVVLGAHVQQRGTEPRVSHHGQAIHHLDILSVFILDW